MNGAFGPPASPTVIRASAAAMASPAPTPSRRIFLRRRPDGSANTDLECTTRSVARGLGRFVVFWWFVVVFWWFG